MKRAGLPRRSVQEPCRTDPFFPPPDSKGQSAFEARFPLKSPQRGAFRKWPSAASPGAPQMRCWGSPRCSGSVTCRGEEQFVLLQEQNAGLGLGMGSGPAVVPLRGPGVAPEETERLGLVGDVLTGCKCHVQVTEKPARGLGAFWCWSLGLLLGSRR